MQQALKEFCSSFFLLGLSFWASKRGLISISNQNGIGSMYIFDIEELLIKLSILFILNPPFFQVIFKISQKSQVIIENEYYKRIRSLQTQNSI